MPIRSFAFQRLSVFGSLWYFLLVLLLAGTSFFVGVQLELLALTAVLELVFGSARKLAKSLAWSAPMGLIIAFVTLFFDYYGPTVLFRWGRIVTTWQGLNTGVCLGLAFVTITTAALTQSRVVTLGSLMGSRTGRILSRALPRTVLVTQMSLGSASRLTRQSATLLAVEHRLASSGTTAGMSADASDATPDKLSARAFLRADSRASWTRRLRALLYALLSTALNDSAARTTAIASTLAAMKRSDRQTARTAPHRPSRAPAALVFLVLTTACFAAALAHPWGASRWETYAATAVLTASPYLLEGGERLWACARA